MLRARAGSGLGDSLYLRPIVDHLVHAGHTVTALSEYPGIFLGSGATVMPFRREHADVIAHYVARKTDPRTNQWQDVCAAAGIPEIPLSMRWPVLNTGLTSAVREAAAKRRIVLVHAGREPMAREDRFARELLPVAPAIAAALGALPDCFKVGIGKGPMLYPVPVDLDLRSLTSEADLLDLAVIAHGMLGQCSFLIPLAELFDKPLVVVWARAGLSSKNDKIRTITPSKVLSKATSGHVFDDWSAEAIAERTRAVLRMEAFA